MSGKAIEGAMKKENHSEGQAVQKGKMMRFLIKLVVGTGAAGFIETRDEGYRSLYGIAKDLGIDLKSYSCRKEG